MAISAGTVTIAADGTTSGSGFAKALADAKLAAFAGQFPSDSNALAAVYTGIAADCNASAAIITYLLANAVPVVSGNNGTLT